MPEENSNVDRLFDLLTAIHPLNDYLRKKIKDETFTIRVKKNKYILSPMDKDENIYLIIKGVARGFVKDGKSEITHYLSSENDFIGSVKNLWSNTYADYYIQALEDVTLICLPHSFLQTVYQNSWEANFTARIIMEKYYQAAEERAFIGRIHSAERRYARFLQTKAKLINRISLKYIASFLGMRLETLSRIRTARLDS